MDRQHVISKYIEHVLETGSSPPSVFAFAKAHEEFSEREFFEAFASFEALESEIWRNTVSETVSAIESGPEWEGFNAEQKMLTFHYAYCEKILDHRSFFLARFPRLQEGKLPNRSLNGMRMAFTEFAEKVVGEGVAKGEVACRGPLSRTYPHGLFAHFMSVVEFNLGDDSAGFERTDAYVEKSVKLAFDVIGTQALDSAFDLVRFLSGRSKNHPTQPHPDPDHGDH